MLCFYPRCICVISTSAQITRCKNTNSFLIFQNIEVELITPKHCFFVFIYEITFIHNIQLTNNKYEIEFLFV